MKIAQLTVLNKVRETDGRQIPQAFGTNETGDLYTWSYKAGAWLLYARSAEPEQHAIAKNSAKLAI